LAKERDADGCALNGNVLAFSVAERSGWGIHAASFAVPAQNGEAASILGQKTMPH